MFSEKSAVNPTHVSKASTPMNKLKIDISDIQKEMKDLGVMTDRENDKENLLAKLSPTFEKEKKEYEKARAKKQHSEL